MSEPGSKLRILSLHDVAARIAAALRSSLGIADRRRWRRVGRRRPDWDGRNRIIASLVSPSSTVLDVGCGAQTMRQHLPATCAYQPCDIIQHDSGVWIWNFNDESFPYPDRRFDYVISSGVAEYARDPRQYIGTIAELGNQVLLSYAPIENVPSIFRRRALGWFNDLSRPQIEALFDSLSLRFEHIARWQGQDIYRLARSRAVPVNPTTSLVPER